jgi:RNA polymerase-binding transcription factor DksA
VAKSAAKAKPAAKPAPQPAAKAKPAPAKPAPAKVVKPTTAKVEKSKPETAALDKKPAATTKPTTGKMVKPVTAKTEKSATGKVAKPATGKVEKAKPVAKVKPERVEKPSKIPVVNRDELTGLTSPFDRQQIKEWRAILIAKRHEITNDIDGLVKDAMEAEDGHTTPNHIAERGSDADLQEFSLAMAGEEKLELWLVDRALRKIDDRLPIPFGLCEYTKKGIQKSRLELLPWTPLSIEGAQYMEENHLTLEDMLIDD